MPSRTLAEAIAERAGWSAASDAAATYQRAGETWTGRVCRVARPQYAGRTWYAAILVDGAARYTTYEYDPSMAVEWVEKSRL